MVLEFSSSCQCEISGSCADFRPAVLHLAGERCRGAVAEVAQVWLLRRSRYLAGAACGQSLLWLANLVNH